MWEGREETEVRMRGEGREESKVRMRGRGKYISGGVGMLMETHHD